MAKLKIQSSKLKAQKKLQDTMFNQSVTAAIILEL